MIQKVFLDSETLLLDSFGLGAMILNSGFIPTYMIAVWRGGTPVGVAVQENSTCAKSMEQKKCAIATHNYAMVQEGSG